MRLCFFEDEGDRLFAPLTLTRPVDDLRIGIITIREKWEYYLNPEHVFRVRRSPLDLLYPSNHPAGSSDVFWISARWMPDPEASKQVIKLKAGDGLYFREHLVAARLPARQSRSLHQNTILPPACRKKIETTAGHLINHLWELFQNNGSEIRKDVYLLSSINKYSPAAFPMAILNRPEQIFCEPGVRIDPGAVIDASEGPVFIGRNTHIMYGAVIEGPGAICDSSVVRMGAKIYSGTTIGPVCKVSGEIQNVILHSHSNKAHDGYLGNSLIGEWCNLGANTTTSNLNNNYKPIKISEWPTGKVFTSSQQFFGTVMADHGKTAINTTLSAGTLCGVFCNIFTFGFPPKRIPSFSWVGPDGLEPYQFDKAMETAEIMMARRNIPLKRDYLLMMRHIYDNRNPLE